MFSLSLICVLMLVVIALALIVAFLIWCAATETVAPFRRLGSPLRRLRFGLLGSALIAGLCLAACVSNGGGALATTPAVQVTIAKGEYGFEAIYNTVATAYLALLPSLPAGKQTQAKALMLSLLDCDAAGRCTGYVQLARDAVAVGNAADVATQTAAISAIAAQVTSLINATK